MSLFKKTKSKKSMSAGNTSHSDMSQGEMSDSGYSSAGYNSSGYTSPPPSHSPSINPARIKLQKIDPADIIKKRKEEEKKRRHDEEKRQREEEKQRKKEEEKRIKLWMKERKEKKKRNGYGSGSGSGRESDGEHLLADDEFEMHSMTETTPLARPPSPHGAHSAVGHFNRSPSRQFEFKDTVEIMHHNLESIYRPSLDTEHAYRSEAQAREFRKQADALAKLRRKRNYWCCCIPKIRFSSR